MNSLYSQAKSLQKKSLVDDPISNPLDSLKILGDFDDIFTGFNLDRTAIYILEQTHRDLYLLSEDELKIIESLVSTFKAHAQLSGEQPFYTVTDDDGNSLTITKALDITSTDFHLSHNHVVINIGDLEIDWYFILDGYGEKTLDENFHNEIEPSNAKSQILYEYSESNKHEFNNTGYKFYRSDKKPLANNKITPFIKQMKNSGDPRFIRDFPDVVDEGTAPPTYEVVGSKHKYYVHTFNLDPLKDGDNLKSKLFSGNTQLEAVHDGSLTLYTISAGEYVKLVREGLNQYYTENKVLVQMPESTAYDEQLVQRVRTFQKREKLPVDGKVGQATIDKLDEWLEERDPKETTTTTTQKKEKHDHSKDKFSLIVLGQEVAKFIAAAKDKDEKETIYSIGEILYQLKLLYNETNDAHPTLKKAQIETAKLVVAPLRLAALAWVPNDPDKVGWYDLMMIWFFELGDNPFEVKNKGAVTIRDLRAHEGVLSVHAHAQALIDTEKEIGEEEYSANFSHVWNYQLNTMKKNLKEMKTLDPGKVNSLELFMGTYLVNLNVEKKKGEEAKMFFLVKNTSHFESATRFRREETIGNGQEGIIYDLPRGTGVCLGGTLKVNFEWQE